MMAISLMYYNFRYNKHMVAQAIQGFITAFRQYDPCYHVIIYKYKPLLSKIMQMVRKWWDYCLFFSGTVQIKEYKVWHLLIVRHIANQLKLSKWYSINRKLNLIFNYRSTHSNLLNPEYMLRQWSLWNILILLIVQHWI